MLLLNNSPLPAVILSLKTIPNLTAEYLSVCQYILREVSGYLRALTYLIVPKGENLPIEDKNAKDW